jgi:hypothetical protein
MNVSVAIADPLRLRVKRRSSLVRRKEPMAYGPEWRVGVFATSYTPLAIRSYPQRDTPFDGSGHPEPAEGRFTRKSGVGCAGEAVSLELRGKKTFARSGVEPVAQSSVAYPPMAMHNEQACIKWRMSGMIARFVGIVAIATGFVIGIYGLEDTGARWLQTALGLLVTGMLAQGYALYCSVKRRQELKDQPKS